MATTYKYVDGDVGNDANTGDAPGVNNAWASMAKLADNIVDELHAYVKASIVYTAEDGANDCIMLISQVPSSAANGVIIEGYTTTPGDGGTVILDAQSTLGDCILNSITAEANIVFRNIRTTRATDTGFALYNLNNVYLDNCRGDNCSVYGANLNDYCAAYRSQFDNNANGFAADLGGQLISSRVFANTARGAFMFWGVFINNVLNDNADSELYLYNNERFNVAYGNTIDGVDGAGSIGVALIGTGKAATVINNIVYHADFGIFSDTDHGPLDIIDNNLFADVGTEYTLVDAGPNDISSVNDPFVDSAGNDYGLAVGSEAVSAGVDGGIWGDGDGSDIGAIQSGTGAGAVVLPVGMNAGMRG